jgi:hypothetical protein
MSRLLLPLAAWMGIAHAAELDGRAEVTGPEDDRRLWVYNDSDADWDQVMVIVNGSLVCKTEAVPADAMAELAFSGCDGTIAGPVTTALIQSTQGSVALAGDRLTRLDETPGDPAAAAPMAAAEPAAEPAPVPEPIDELRVRVTVSGGFAAARVLTVYNDSANSITACKVTVNGTWHDFLHALGSAQKDRMPLTGFRDGESKVMKSNVQVHDVAVTCDQGTATVQP